MVEYREGPLKRWIRVKYASDEAKAGREETNTEQKFFFSRVIIFFLLLGIAIASSTTGATYVAKVMMWLVWAATTLWVIVPDLASDWERELQDWRADHPEWSNERRVRDGHVVGRLKAAAFKLDKKLHGDRPLP